MVQTTSAKWPVRFLLRQFVHGIGLLGMCPDNVNARIISKGERVSIQLMKAVLAAKGHAVNLIDPVEYLLAGDHLEGMVDVDISTQNFRNKPLPAGHVHIMPGFTAVTNKVSWSRLDVTVLTTRRRCSRHVCARIAVKSGRMLMASTTAIRDWLKMLGYQIAQLSRSDGALLLWRFCAASEDHCAYRAVPYSLLDQKQLQPQRGRHAHRPRYWRR